MHSIHTRIPSSLASSLRYHSTAAIASKEGNRHYFARSLLLTFLVSITTAIVINSASAAPLPQITTVRNPILQGELTDQYTAHYYGVEVNQRDQLVALTLAYEPQNNRNLQGYVNFMVLDEDGMRRFLAGTSPRELELAAGSPLQFDPVGNKTSATFRAVGRGEYTVIVFNNAPRPIRYTLVAEGAVLVDNANQSGLSSEAEENEATAEATATEQVIAPSPLGNATGSTLSGTLSNTIGRHYLQVLPAIRDGQLRFEFRFDPLDQPDLYGNVNFWILDEEGLNAIIRGDKAGDVNLATGFPIPFNPFPNELQAAFKASGRAPYTAVIYNNTSIPAQYEFSVDGGTLVDRYGQTTEAKASIAAQTTMTSELTSQVNSGITVVADDIIEVDDTSSIQLAGRNNIKSEQSETIFVSQTTVETTDETTDEIISDPFQILGVPQVSGNFNRAYSYHYLALTPTLRDGTIRLSLEFDPKDNQDLRENINFLVLTEDGLRNVMAGGPPTNYDIATGAFGLFGANQDKLFASFQASGRGKYTVIVYNRSSVRARYILSAEGGLLATEEVEVSLP